MIVRNGRGVVEDHGPSRGRITGYGGSLLGHPLTLTLIKYTKPSAVPLREKDRRRAEKRRRGL